MKQQMIKRDGKPEYAEIPYQEYRRLQANGVCFGTLDLS